MQIQRKLCLAVCTSAWISVEIFPGILAGVVIQRANDLQRDLQSVSAKS